MTEQSPFPEPPYRVPGASAGERFEEVRQRLIAADDAQKIAWDRYCELRLKAMDLREEFMEAFYAR